MKESFCRDIYRVQSNVIAAPVASVWADTDFLQTVEVQRPQTVFFRLDQNLHVLATDETIIASLYDCLSVTKLFIPVFYFDDFKVAQKLSAFVYEHAIGDAVLCVPYEKKEVLEQAFLLMPLLRCMMDCRALNADTDWMHTTGQIWKSRAISLLITAAQCTRETVDLLHERLLSVWCEANDEWASVIFDGVDGVITEQVEGLYSLLEKLPEHSLLDRYRIIAHKGFQDGYTEPENSITAVKKGADYALDGAEIDIKLTTDGIPFVIHNPSTKAMLKGDPRDVESLSSTELSSLERTDFPGEYTDRLEDMMQALKGYKNYPIFIEFKPNEKLYHVEKMTHAVKGIVERTGTEYMAVALCVPQAMRYVQRLLPTLPKISGVWENPDPPKNMEQANELLYRLCERLSGTPAALCVEDVMVNPLFGAAAAMRGIFTVVWTRSWYFKHSLWENDGVRSDEGFISGFYATISDHAEHYFDIPRTIDIDNQRNPIGVMRDFSRKKVEDATLYDLGNGTCVWGVEITLPNGLKFHMFSKAFPKE